MGEPISGNARESVIAVLRTLRDCANAVLTVQQAATQLHAETCRVHVEYSRLLEMTYEDAAVKADALADEAIALVTRANELAEAFKKVQI